MGHVRGEVCGEERTDDEHCASQSGEVEMLATMFSEKSANFVLF